MGSSFFNNSRYYYISATFSGAIYNISDGYDDSQDIPGSLFLTNTSYSSNNWQIFYQDSVYLIRNYDYGLDYQLGVNTTSSSPLPELLPASGELTQQWNITKLNDGSFRVNNMELGSSQVLGVEIVLDGPSQLAMNDADHNGDDSVNHWNFGINGVVPQSMQSSVLLQAPTATSTGTSSSSATTGATSTTSAATNSSAASAHSKSTGSKGLSGGAIGGIVAGIILALLIVLGLLLLMLRRRRRQGARAAHEMPISTPHEIHSQPVHELDSSKHNVKIGTPEMSAI